MPRHPLVRKLAQAGSFLVIGGIAFLVDAVTYNLLVFGFSGLGPLHAYPLPAKIFAIVVASVVTYVGNRFWTFNDRHLPHRWSRYALFVVFNLVAMGLQLGCLAFSRYVLGLDGIVADNISGTFIGQALATAFRFVTYDRWVFPHDGAGAEADASGREPVREVAPEDRL
ncbi:GtrA family protein [Microbacterium sp. ZXX196]|uniref:GtrA family protein n=1 Tax=Microbacterium sp. ZXX196 TaxID=2609291 RepID=UPI0012B75A7D|nr:GtrA family protein [Microbacterium sp. ZXX196]MTE22732.1 GtrA family protein [Microbacterium sp. ZXX196]